MSEKLFYNPEYLDKINFLKQQWAFYNGNHNELVNNDNYLWRYEIEMLPQFRNGYQNRKKRTRYTNLIKPIVNIWKGLFFKEDFEYNENIDKNEFNNIDGQNTSLEELTKNKILPSILLTGENYIWIDSLGEDSSGKINPIIKWVNPVEVVDWSIEQSDADRVGLFNFIRIEKTENTPRTNARQAPSTHLISYLFSKVNEGVLVEIFISKDSNKFSFIKKEGEYQKINELLLNIDEIPIVSIKTNSWLREAVEQQMRFFNLESALDNILYYQGYPIRFITGFEQGVEFDNIPLTESTLMFLPEGATAGTIASADVTALENRLQTTMNNIFRQGLNQIRQLGAESKQVASAETLRAEQEITLSIVKSEIKNIEDTLNKTLKFYFMFQGIEQNIEGDFVTLSKDLTIEDIDKTISIYTTLRDELNKLPITKKEIVKNLINKLSLQNDSEVNNEIENTDLTNKTKLQNSNDILNRFING